MKVHLYRPGTAPEVAVVSLEHAGEREAQLRVARAPSRDRLGAGTVAGPAPALELWPRFEAAIAALRAEGFRRAGVDQRIAELSSKSPKVRARAAVRLGGLGEREAVAPLVAAAAGATGESCAITDALGALGDPRGVPVARAQAGRKLLSRRRSGVEALRRLGDYEGLAAALATAAERLPAGVRLALDAAGPIDDSNAAVATVRAAIEAAPATDRGLAVDTLYEIGSPLALAATRAWMADRELGVPWTWRYAKSILKRAILRHDHRTVGWLAHAIEAEARHHGAAVAELRSGLDGETRQTRVFSRPTVNHLRRLVWRTLRALARDRPGEYAVAAALAVVPYGHADLATPKGREDELSRLYVLHQVLRGVTPRWIVAGSLRARLVKKAKAPEPARPEPHPELWDATPRAVVLLLAEARLWHVHAFALAAAGRGGGAVLAAATTDDLIRFLDAPHEGTVELGLGELDRRFDPRAPDLALVARLAADARPRARETGLRWMRLAAAAWAQDPAVVLAFLGAAVLEVRQLAAELVLEVLPALPATARAELAAGILALLGGPGDHEEAGRVARVGLLDELAPLVTFDGCLALIDGGAPPAQALAALLLERHPEAFAQLGLPRLLGLAEHEVAVVRAAAARLLGAAGLPRLRDDPSPLFLLAESDWDDTRAAAVALLATLDLARLGIDGLIALCDSTRPEVQELGRTLVRRHFATLDAREVASRLAEHPHRGMRAFALDLAEEHLPQGFVALAKIEGLLRAILFDVHPSRKLKRRVIELLARRGSSDERQAELAVAILGAFARTRGRDDLERTLEALARIRLAFPAIEVPAP